MTPAQRTQVDYCKALIAEGYAPADLRSLGYAQAAIDAAINEIERAGE